MRFIKDLLIFDLETTGPNPDKDTVIQLAGVLLDKDNLLEKGVYNSYIRASLLEGTINEHARLLNISYDTLSKSPKVYDAVKRFHEQWGKQVLLACHTFEKLQFLKQAFKKAVVPFDYDRHVVELWTLEYLYTQRKGIKIMPTFATLLDHFGLKQRNPHNALENARLAAEVFRKIII